jgi:hypothetical protein
VFVLIDDAIRSRAVQIPRRPGPTPACSDAEVLTIALVRHLLGRPSEAGFVAEVARDWANLFPHLPAQSELNRRVRWLWGAFELLRRHLAARLPVDPWQQVDTSALPVKHPSRVRGPDGWVGPVGLHAGFGRDAAHAEGFYGFRLAVRTDLGSRLPRAWGSSRPPSTSGWWPMGCWPARRPRRGCCWTEGSPAGPGPASRPPAARGWWSPTAALTGGVCQLPPAARSLPCAIGWRQASARSPSSSAWPATAPTRSGAADAHRCHHAGPYHPAPRPCLNDEPT